MSSEPLPDKWYSVDLPVLREVIRQLDDGGWKPSIEEVGTAISIDPEEVRKSFRRLVRGNLLTEPPRESRRAGWDFDDVASFTAAALPLSGQWPTPETALDRIITALELIAGNTAEDEDTRNRARKVLDGLTSAGRTVGLSVAAAAISAQIPS